MKRHFLTKEGKDIACWRVLTSRTWTTDSVSRVDCENCKNEPEYQAAAFAIKEAKDAAFAAQVPHTVYNPWAKKNMVCHECGGDQFKDMDRDLWTYWFYCVGCTKNQGYPTETGMCQ